MYIISYINTREITKTKKKQTRNHNKNGGFHNGSVVTAFSSCLKSRGCFLLLGCFCTKAQFYIVVILIICNN